MTLRLQRSIMAMSALVLFGAFFPWIFISQTSFFGIPISIRALGDAAGALLILLGLAALLSPTVKNFIRDLARDLDTSSLTAQTRTVIGFSLLYAIVAISHKLRAQALFATHAYDLGFFSNICWNTANGHWFLSSELERNFMAVHVNWILWPLALFYKAGGDARVLLVAQAGFVVASIPLLWSLVRRVTGSFSAGFLAALLFVCSPYINHSVSNDFHPDLWLLPCLFASLLCWHRNKPTATVAFALLALLAKEDVSVVVCAWGVLLFFKRSRVAGATLFAISLAVFLFHTQIFIPHYLGEGQKSLLFERYAFFNGSYTRIDMVQLMHAIVDHPEKYIRVAAYLLPMGGLTLLAPAFLFPAAISLLPHILSQASTQLDLADIYSMPAQPFLFVGAAFGAVILVKHCGARSIAILTAVLFIVAGAGLLNSPRYFRSKDANRTHALKQMKELIPPNAALLAQQNLYPQFDTRRTIQIFPMGSSFGNLKTAHLVNPEYVACDRIGNALPFDGPYLARSIAALETDPRYRKIFEQQNLIVFQRVNSQEPLQWTTTPPTY